MRATIFIDGEQGTTGLRIRQRLQGRADVELLSLTEARRKDLSARVAAIEASDAAVLCLPDGAAREVVAAVRNPAARILDASSAHRTSPGWTYGLPEMEREQPSRIAAAARISNPGCYPSGAITLLRPLVAEGWLDAHASLSIFAVSGYSGRGRAGIEEHEGRGIGAGASVLPFQVYGLGLHHKHAPEIRAYAGLAHRPLFVPSYGNFRQGIVLTVPVHRSMLARPASADLLRECLAHRYRDCSRIRVLDRPSSAALERLDPQLLNGTDDLQLAVFGDDAQGQILLAAVFDNLGKGAAGAAVENLELMLGLGGVDANGAGATAAPGPGMGQ